MVKFTINCRVEPEGETTEVTEETIRGVIKSAFTGDKYEIEELLVTRSDS